MARPERFELPTFWFDGSPVAARRAATFCSDSMVVLNGLPPLYIGLELAGYVIGPLAGYVINLVMLMQCHIALLPMRIRWKLPRQCRRG